MKWAIFNFRSILFTFILADIVFPVQFRYGGAEEGHRTMVSLPLSVVTFASFSLFYLTKLNHLCDLFYSWTLFVQQVLP